MQCYYVGGLEESATGMLSEMSKPVSWSMPADKICMKLYRRDEQICDLRYGIFGTYMSILLQFQTLSFRPCSGRALSDAAIHRRVLYEATKPG